MFLLWLTVLSLSLSLSPQCDKTTSEAIENYNWFKISLASATIEEEINFQWQQQTDYIHLNFRETWAQIQLRKMKATS